MIFAKVNPVGPRIVIRPHESSSVSESGLVMSNSSNTATGKVLGEIVETSPESKFKDMIGKKVLFRRYSIDELKFITQKGEQTVHLVDDDEVLALPITE